MQQEQEACLRGVGQWMQVMELLKMPLLTAETGGAALGPSETFEETFRKIDIDGTDSLSWPEVRA